MGKEILNRRQNILADSIPPEIPTGAVTATSYATSSTGGVIKVDGEYGLDITSGGKLKGKAISAANYAAANNAAILCKETYENIKPGVASADALGMIKVGSGLSIADGVLSASAAGGATVDLCWTGAATDNQNVDLTTALTGYTLALIVAYKDVGGSNYYDASAIVPVALLGTGNPDNMVNLNCGSGYSANVTVSTAKVRTSSVNGFDTFKVYGIK